MKLTHGFTIIELMIYVVLSMLIALGLTSVLITTKQTTNTANAVNRVQVNGLNLLSFLSYEIQNAGFKGSCLAQITEQANSSNNINEILYDFSYPVFGWINNKPNIPALSDWSQEGDILLVQFSSKNTDELKNANATDRVFISSLDVCEPMTKQELPIISSEDDKEIYIMHSYLYYLAADDTNEDTYSLVRLNFDTTTGTSYSNPTKEVVMRGVKTFDIKYTTPTALTSSEKWLTAEEITNSNAWREVSSIQMRFIIVDTQKNALVNNKKIIADETTEIESARAADVFIETVNIRNRILQ